LRNQPSNQPASVAADGFPFAASGIGHNLDALFATALGFTHVFSPTFFSETIVSQQWWSEQNEAGGTPLVDFEQKLGTPNNFGAPGFPNITGIITPFNGTMFIYGLTQIIQNLDENRHPARHEPGHNRFWCLRNRPVEPIDDIDQRLFGNNEHGQREC
jgi:hypothetical protein